MDVISFCLLLFLCARASPVLLDHETYAIEEICASFIRNAEVVVLRFGVPDCEHWTYNMATRILKHIPLRDYYCGLTQDTLEVIETDFAGNEIDTRSIHFSRKVTFTVTHYISNGVFIRIVNLSINSTGFFDECSRLFEEEVKAGLRPPNPFFHDDEEHFQ